MKHLSPSDFTEMPWRNGGGVTLEIAKQEDDNGQTLWRISTARVEKDGEYSLFPGLRRVSAVIEGNGIELRDNAAGQALTITSDVIAELGGDTLYHGRLLEGGIRHLNLVYDPKRVAAEMIQRGEGSYRLPDSAQHAIYCVAGTASLADQATAKPGEVLIVNAAKQLTLPANARAFLISLTLK